MSVNYNDIVSRFSPALWRLFTLCTLCDIDIYFIMFYIVIAIDICDIYLIVLLLFIINFSALLFVSLDPIMNYMIISNDLLYND